MPSLISRRELVVKYTRAKSNSMSLSVTMFVILVVMIWLLRPHVEMMCRGCAVEIRRVYQGSVQMCMEFAGAPKKQTANAWFIL